MSDRPESGQDRTAWLAAGGVLFTMNRRKSACPPAGSEATDVGISRRKHR